MAKKRVNVEEDTDIVEAHDPAKVRDRIAKELEQSLGKGIMVRGSEIIEDLELSFRLGLGLILSLVVECPKARGLFCRASQSVERH